MTRTNREYAISEAAKRAMNFRLREWGMSKAWLADQLDCSAASVSKMLNTGKQSYLLPAALGVLQLPEWLLLPGAKVWIDDEGKLRMEKPEPTVEELLEVVRQMLGNDEGVILHGNWRLELTRAP